MPEGSQTLLASAWPRKRKAPIWNVSILGVLAYGGGPRLFCGELHG
jgi:hypothetical protein